MTPRPLQRLRAQTQRIGTASATFLVLFSEPVAAQTGSTGCSANVPEAFVQLAELLTRLQQLGVAVGLALAALGYIIAGILYIVGGVDRKQRAKTFFVNTSIGLVIILLSGGFVEFIKQVLCGGG